MTDLYHVDIFCITEHWLSDQEISLWSLNGFLDASSFCRVSCGRGGSIILVKEYLSFQALDNVSKLSIESVCEVSSVYVEHYNLLLLCIYRPPDMRNFMTFLEKLEEVLNVASSLRQSASIVLCADFNINFLTGLVNQQNVALIRLLAEFGLYLTVHDITRPGRAGGGTCIDNVATTIHPDRVSASILPTVGSDHEAILFECKLITSRSLVLYNTIVYRPISDIGKLYFCSLLCKINWLDLYKVSSLNDQFELFFDKFLSALNVALPLKEKKFSRPRSKNKFHNCAWYTSELSDMKERCLYLYNLYKTSNFPEIKSVYKENKSKYMLSVNQAKKAFLNQFINTAKNKSKAVWSVVNSTIDTNDKSGFGNADLTASCFNDFFVGEVERVVNNIGPSVKSSVNYLSLFNLLNHPLLFTFRHVSVEEVFIKINKLSNSRSFDASYVNSCILKISNVYIVEVLTYLFNRCISEGLFPKCLKISKIVPVFKKGLKTEYKNYRPIAIIDTVSKVFESLLHDQMIMFFERNCLFSSSQFGFRKGHSTIEAVMKFVNNCLFNLEKSEHVDCRLYDLTKAFDTVSHDIIIDKLFYYGFDVCTVNLIKSYLEDRYQFVFYNGSRSDLKLVRHGVPQGSILGPFLFTLYINDLPSVLSRPEVETYLFADDLAIVGSSVTNTMLRCLLHITDNNVKDWCSANYLSVNEDKIKDLTVNLNRRLKTESVKFLGIHLESSLGWDTHVNAVTKKLSKGIFILRKLCNLVDLTVLKSLYYAFVHSHLSYGIILWGNHHSAHNAFLLQKKAIRVICGVPWKTHCKPLFIKLQIMSVPSLYVFHCLIYIKKESDNNRLVTYVDVHPHNTRNRNNILTNYCKFATTQNNFKFVSTKMFNSLPTITRNLDLRSFTLLLRKKLLSCCLYYVSEYYQICDLIVPD